jgi:hypothetical protein
MAKIDLAQMARDRKSGFLARWRRWRAAVNFVDVLFKSRRVHVSAIDR